VVACKNTDGTAVALLEGGMGVGREWWRMMGWLWGSGSHTNTVVAGVRDSPLKRWENGVFGADKIDDILH